MVEHRLPKPVVAGSIPVSRSRNSPNRPSLWLNADLEI
jgi:hypothetical protein